MTNIKSLSFLFVVFTATTLFLSNTKGESKTIPWQADKKLTWDDFVDTLITNSSRVAMTSSGMRVNFAQTDEKTIQVTAVSEMTPEKSRVDSTKKSNYMLGHEQYHFNITEYWCRKLKYDLVNAHITTKNFKEKLTSMQRGNFSDCRNMQDTYDRETNHSMIQDKQAMWQERIDGLLKSLDSYTKAEVKITLK